MKKVLRKSIILLIVFMAAALVIGCDGPSNGGSGGGPKIETGINLFADGKWLPALGTVVVYGPDAGSNADDITFAGANGVALTMADDVYKAAKGKDGVLIVFGNAYDFEGMKATQISLEMEGFQWYFATGIMSTGATGWYAGDGAAIDWGGMINWSSKFPDGVYKHSISAKIPYKALDDADVDMTKVKALLLCPSGCVDTDDQFSFSKIAIKVITPLN